MSGSVRTCCVEKCGRARSHSEGTALHSFPHPEKEKERFLTWINAVPLSELGKHLDALFNTDEIGTFRIRQIDCYRGNKVALDFKSGFDAMHAVEILNGYQYTMTNGRPNTLKARINDFQRAIERLKQEEMMAEHMRRSLKAKRKLKKEMKRRQRSSTPESLDSSDSEEKKRRAERKLKKLRKRSESVASNSKHGKGKSKKRRHKSKETSPSSPKLRRTRSPVTISSSPTPVGRRTSPPPRKRIRSPTRIHSRSPRRSHSPYEKAVRNYRLRTPSRNLPRSRSISKTKHRSRSPTRIKLPRSRSPSRMKLPRSRSPSRIKLPRSRSPSRIKLPRSRSPSKVKLPRSRSPSKIKLRRSRSPSRNIRRSRSPSKIKLRRSRSPSKIKLRRSRSPSRIKHRSRSPSRSRLHRSRSPSRSRRHSTRSPCKSSRHRSPSPPRSKYHRDDPEDYYKPGTSRNSVSYHEDYKYRSTSTRPEYPSTYIKKEPLEISPDANKIRKEAIDIKLDQLGFLLDWKINKSGVVLPDADKDNIMFNIKEMIEKRFKDLKVYEDMNALDLIKHYKRRNYDHDDDTMVQRLLNEILDMNKVKVPIAKPEASGDVTTQNEEPQDSKEDVWRDVDNLLQEVKTEEPLEEGEIPTTRVIISLNVVARSKPDDEPEYEPLSKQAFSGVPLPRKPRFMLPLKKIFREMRPYLKPVNNTEIDEKFSQILRKTMRQRMAKILKGKPRMATREVVSLYREHFPEESDAKFVEAILEGVLDGFYNDVTHSDLDDEIEPGTATKDDQTKPEEETANYSPTPVVKEEIVDRSEMVTPKLELKEEVDEQIESNETTIKTEHVEPPPPPTLIKAEDIEIIDLDDIISPVKKENVKRETPAVKVDKLSPTFAEYSRTRPKVEIVDVEDTMPRGNGQIPRGRVKQEEDEVYIVESDRNTIVIDDNDATTTKSRKRRKIKSEDSDCIVFEDVIHIKSENEPKPQENITIVRERKTENNESERYIVTRSQVNSVIVERNVVKKERATVTEIFDDSDPVTIPQADNFIEEAEDCITIPQADNGISNEPKDIVTIARTDNFPRTDLPRTDVSSDTNKETPSNNAKQDINVTVGNENVMVLKQEPEESVETIGKYMELFSVVDADADID